MGCPIGGIRADNTAGPYEASSPAGRTESSFEEPVPESGGFDLRLRATVALPGIGQPEPLTQFLGVLDAGLFDHDAPHQCQPLDALPLLTHDPGPRRPLLG